MDQIIKLFTTENELLCNILTFPLSIIELWVSYIFIKTIYNLEEDRISKIKYILVGCTLATFIRLLLPLPYNTIIGILSFIIINILILNLSVFRSIIIQIIISIIATIFEILIGFIITKIFNTNLINSVNIPIFKVFFSCSLHLFTFIMAIVLSKLKVNLNISDQMNKKQKIKAIANILIILAILSPNLIFLIFIDMNIPIYYIIYCLISSFIFFFLGTYNTHEYNKLDMTSRELETANLYNETLNQLVDANRGFKHDMNNIIQAIGGYLELKDYDGLKEYYDTGLLPEIEKVNNLSLLNPETINSAPIFGLFLGKYNYADSKNVKVNLKSFFDYSTINMNTFDFVKIFGILFDNAIEAASLCDEKLVDIYVSIDFYNRKQVFTIKNTYSDKNIDTEKIFEKDFSTKKKKSGFGLWEVKEILKRYQNATLETTKDDHLFCQKLEIYF